MSVQVLPIFPLQTVLFPGGRLPLKIFETRYMDMIRTCLKTGQRFGVCLIREGSEVGAPAIPYPVGCLARIVDCDMQQLGLLHLRTRGEERFRILASESNRQGLISAEVQTIPAEPEIAVPDRYTDCVRLIELVARDTDRDMFDAPHEFGSAAWVGFRLAEVLPLVPAARQLLLELEDPLGRLEILQRFLEERGLKPR